jgi:hypothetical protein
VISNLLSMNMGDSFNPVKTEVKTANALTRSIGEILSHHWRGIVTSGGSVIGTQPPKNDCMTTHPALRERFGGLGLCGTLALRGVQDFFPKPKIFRRGFDVFVGGDVFQRAFQAHL